MNWEQNYLGLLKYVLEDGHCEKSRAGPTIAINGAKLEIRVGPSRFPLLTTRRMYPAGVFGELAAFLRGATTVAQFREFGCNYWDYNARQWPRNNRRNDEELEVGPVYGAQWRRFNGDRGCDQLAAVRHSLLTDPTSRRHIITAWNPQQLKDMCLPPCHTLFQYHVREHEVDCTVHMRSVDLCLGMPSDIVLYYTLLLLMCADTGYSPGNLVFLLGNAHIYEAHLSNLEEQLKRPVLEAPKYQLADVPHVSWYTDDFTPDMMEILDYKSAEAIKYELL